MTDESSSKAQSELAGKPSVPARKTGLSPKQQKLQAMLEKAANSKGGGHAASGATQGGFKAKSSFAGKKTAFQRKAT